MAVPSLKVRVDWANDGTFTTAGDDVSDHVLSDTVSWTRGRSADFSAEATGAASFTLRNDDEHFTPDRNWCDNPSFEVDTAGWTAAASAGLTSAATSITKVADNAPGAGIAAGEAVLPAVSGAGVAYPIPYRFRAGVPYSVGVSLKSMSGSTSIAAGIGGYNARYAAACLATAPLAYWRLGEASGTVAADASGNGRTGTYVGAPTLGATGLLTGDSDTSMTLNGSSQEVTALVDFSGTSAFSVAAWINHTPGALYQTIMGSYQAGAPGPGGWMFDSTSTNLRFERWTAAGDAALAPPLSAGRHFVVGTYDGTTLRIYVDGAASGTPLASSRSVPVGLPLHIGHTPSVYDWFTGTIDDPAVWTRAITSTEVSTLWAAGTTAETATGAGTITGSWARYTFGWTPAADTTAASFFLRSTVAAAATFRIDAVQVNPGPAPNPYIEAPTKGQLVPGRPVHLYATYSAVDSPRFFGYIERITPDAVNKTVAITCYDVFRRHSETDVAVGANGLVGLCPRDYRIEALSDFERGDLNLCHNGDFATNTSGWSALYAGSPTITRITTDSPPVTGSGTCCAEWVTTGGSLPPLGVAAFPIRLVPMAFSGVTYRVAAWVKVVTAAAGQTLALQLTGGGVTAGVVIPYTATTWTRYTVCLTLTASVGASSATALTAQLCRTDANAGGTTVRLGAVSVTRGLADPSQAVYSPTGTSGRWPNYCGNGSFDGRTLNGWYSGWTNLIGNPSFETNTAGWSVAGDAFTAPTTSITRSATHPKFGANGADIVSGGANAGTFYAITGTFVAGTTYAWSLWVWCATAPGFTVGIGSQGTPADKSQLFVGATAGAFKQYSGTWVPSSNRTDAHLYVFGGTAANFSIDAAHVFRRDSWAVSDPLYSNTGPGGGGSFASEAIGATAKYGASSLAVTTPATATAGMVYDFNHIGAYFIGGRAYTLSVWLWCAGSLPYKVGIAANKGDGTRDEASTTGTASANAWTQVTLTWTPSADRSSLAPFDAVLYAYQTDGTARTFDIDGVRVIPGSSADDFEMAQWDLATGTECSANSGTVSFAASALSVLGTMNSVTLSRHFIVPTMSAPWYQYVTREWPTFAAKASAETFDDDVSMLTNADIDRASIVNLVGVDYGSTEYYSDAPSVKLYGVRPTGTIAGAGVLNTKAVADIIGPAVVARYKDPRARPTMTVVNRFPSQLQRELDELVTVNYARLGISGGSYIIARIDTKLSDAGNTWTTDYVIEEAP